MFEKAEQQRRDLAVLHALAPPCRHVDLLNRIFLWRLADGSFVCARCQAPVSIEEPSE